jgi:hypothetical protein
MKVFVAYLYEDRPAASAIIASLEQQYTILDAFREPAGKNHNEKLRYCAKQSDFLIVICSSALTNMGLFRDDLLKVTSQEYIRRPDSVFAVVLTGAMIPEGLRGCRKFPIEQLSHEQFAPLRDFIEVRRSGEQPASARHAEKIDQSAIEALHTLSTFPLKQKQVVGNYFRWSESNVNKLRDWTFRIERSLKNETCDVFLIGGSSGSGKSFFIEQISDVQSAAVAFHRLDFANMTISKIKSSVEEIRNADRPTLVLFDEVDVSTADLAFYNETFQILERNETAHNRTCALVGSLDGGFSAVASSLKAREPKCRDFAGRIIENNCFDVPELDVFDRLAVLAGQMQKSMTNIPREFWRIEKLAVYFIFSNQNLNTSRTLRNLYGPAIKRFKERGGEKGILFQDLFEPGELTAKMFFADHRSLIAPLHDTYVHFE